MLDWSKPEQFNIEDIKLVILSRIDYLMDEAVLDKEHPEVDAPRPLPETLELIKLAQAMQVLEKEV